MSTKTAIITLVGIIGAGVIGYFIGNNSGMRSMHSQMNMNTGMHMMGNNNSMGSMMMDMNANLKGKTGDDFDRAFIDEMIVHHQGAIDMAELALTSSNRPEMKQLANDIITAQTREIQMMQGWRNTWFTK